MPGGAHAKRVSIGAELRLRLLAYGLGLLLALLCAFTLAASAQAETTVTETGTGLVGEEQAQGTESGTTGETTPPAETTTPPSESTTPDETTPPTESTPPGETTQQAGTTPAETITAETTTTETTSVTSGADESSSGLSSKEDPTKLGDEEKQALSLEEAAGDGHGGSSSADQPDTVAITPESPIVSGAAEGAAQPLAGARDEQRLPSPSSGNGSSHSSLLGASAGEGGGTGCPLGSFDSRLSGSCSGLLGAQRVLASAVSDAIAAMPSSTPPGSDGDDHNRSTISAPPVNPSPGPPPAGAAGGAAAAGGSGMALSGFLSLAGLLLLAAPRALRRLRLSFRPWRAYCVALIPERPG